MLARIVGFLSWTALAALAAGCALFCWQLPSRSLGLAARAAGPGELRITWNRASAPVLLASLGTVEIEDGEFARAIALTGDELRRGSLTYQQQSPSVRVRLRVVERSRWARLAPAEEAGWFASPMTSRESAARSVETTDTLPSPLPMRTEEEANRDRAPEPAYEPPPLRVVAARRRAEIPDLLPVANVQPPLPPAPVPPPLSPPPSGVPVPPIAAPEAVLPPPARPNVYSGPRSGRVIWTGSMGHRGVVEIQGAHASIGSLSGGLPGVPVNLRISPADLSSRGMLVYTSDASRNQRQEPASAANGWNPTLFRWEPERARELVILEAPTAANGFQRLVLRNDARTCELIVIEWSAR
jgi:hypothetical protein